MSKKALCIGEISGGKTKVAGICQRCGRMAKNLVLGTCPRCAEGRRTGKIRACAEKERRVHGNGAKMCRNCDLSVGKGRCPAVKDPDLGREKKKYGRCQEWLPKWDNEVT